MYTVPVENVNVDYNGKTYTLDEKAVQSLTEKDFIQLRMLQDKSSTVRKLNYLRASSKQRIKELRKNISAVKKGSKEFAKGYSDLLGLKYKSLLGEDNAQLFTTKVDVHPSVYNFSRRMNLL